LQIKTVKDRNERKELSVQGRTLETRYENLVREKGNADELMAEFKWMEGVTDLEKFKIKIQTKMFWADSWAINILERALNIKMVIFSSESYRQKDFDNVLHCGELVDNDVLDNGEFKPDNYILTSYSGDHYILITYNNDKIFTFDTMPHTVKQLIVDKCGENDNGIYNIIPDFKAFKNDIKLNGVGESKRMSLKDIPFPSKHASIDISENKVQDMSSSPPNNTSMRKCPEQTPSLEDIRSVKFDPDTVFQFYSKSSGALKPGKGSGEKIFKTNMLEYSCLAGIPDWRRVLSNFHMVSEPFELDGMRWASVEHFYQASKFKKDNPEFYATFSTDSGSELSKDPVQAKSAGGRTGKYKGKQIRDKGVKIDPDFFDSGESARAMYRGQYGKYKSDELSKKVLMSTKNALLQHYSRGSPPIIFYDTMKIRESLRN